MITLKNTLSLFGEDPMQRNQKNIEKTKKKQKNKKNNTIWKLLVGPPHPQDLWNIGFSRCFFCFVPIPPIPKTSGILFFFLVVFSMLLLVCANPPHPRIFFCCFILFFVSRQNRIVLCSQCFFSCSH